MLIPPFQRGARSKGIPALGAGASYPVIPDFEIPAHWPHAFGMDVAWNRTAVVCGALDRETGVLYLYSEHSQGEAEPSVHVQAIRARGEWIRGAIDPASRGRSQVDGWQLWQMYTECAEIDRHGVGNERVPQGRSGAPPGA